MNMKGRGNRRIWIGVWGCSGIFRIFLESFLESSIREFVKRYNLNIICTRHHLYDHSVVRRTKSNTMRRVTVTMEPDDYAAPNQLAERSEVSASWLIRRSMRELPNRHRDDRQVQVMPGQNTP
ncbi:CopG family transcriptional regulator [Candidatus Poribacteria bacterium]|nr:CopG family transcriptional regulator [Gammaproteobacteria bacterium]MYG00174.1 CopG family transcriptional regulator [Candidatus Poribacteria bacterium]